MVRFGANSDSECVALVVDCSCGLSCSLLSEIVELEESEELDELDEARRMIGVRVPGALLV